MEYKRNKKKMRRGRGIKFETEMKWVKYLK